MALCKKCGTQIDEFANVCPNCGEIQNGAPAAAADNGGFLWGLLGCCIPIVGLILFIVWKDTKPKSAKAAGIGALVSFVVGVLFYVLIMSMGVAVGLSGL